MSKKVFSVALLENTNWCSIYSKNNEVYEKGFLHLKPTALLWFHLFLQALLKIWLIHDTFTVKPLHEAHAGCSPLVHPRSDVCTRSSSELPLYFLPIHSLLFSAGVLCAKIFSVLWVCMRLPAVFQQYMGLLCQRDRAGSCLGRWSSRSCNLFFDYLVYK